MNSVDKVRKILKDRKIPVSRMEKDLRYANGYISGLKKGSLPDDRLKEIAEYLNVSTADLIDEKTPLPRSPFESYLISLGYNYINDDPEHGGFLMHDDEVVSLRYGDMLELEHMIDLTVSEKLESLYMRRRLTMYANEIERLNAAHKIENATKEDLQYDNDIMDGRDF